jgi:hypothetical protein
MDPNQRMQRQEAYRAWRRQLREEDRPWYAGRGGCIALAIVATNHPLVFAFLGLLAFLVVIHHG